MSECGVRVERASYFLGPCVEPSGHSGIHSPVHNWAWHEAEKVARCQRCRAWTEWPDDWRNYPRDTPPVIAVSIKTTATQDSGLTE